MDAMELEVDGCAAPSTDRLWAIDAFFQARFAHIQARKRHVFHRVTTAERPGALRRSAFV
jgi:hypothetical protein